MPADREEFRGPATVGSRRFVERRSAIDQQRGVAWREGSRFMVSDAAFAGVLEHILVHDVDAHVTEPPDLWTSRVSAKWGDRIPHVVTDDATGAEFWHIGDDRIAGVAATAYAGWRLPPPTPPPTLAEAAPGAWQPDARLQWMDEQGVFSQVLYPNILGFVSPHFLRLDAELRLACVRAYNDFLTAFCSLDTKRLIPVATVPWWDVEASIAEIERCTSLGHRGVVMPWQFEKAGLPPLRARHWSRLLGCVEEIGMPVSFHVGFGEETLLARKQAGLGSEAHGVHEVAGHPDERTLNLASDVVKLFLGNAPCITELITGLVCHRHPNLRFVSVESGMGYLPYLIEALDWQFVNLSVGDRGRSVLLPSEYFRRQIYGTFWFERTVDRLADLYPDNFMFESDFPHPTSLSPGPNTRAKGPRDTIVQNLRDMPEVLLQKLLQDNAARVYGLDTFAPQT
jgi:predicted TIM-barrel fold metal-dependent hydrolase